MKERNVNKSYMLIFYNVFSRYNYSFNFIICNYKILFNKIYGWQTKYILQYYKSLPVFFRYNIACKHFVNIIFNSYLFNCYLGHKLFYPKLYKNIYNIPKYIRTPNAVSHILNSFNCYYNLYYNMLYVVYFNLVLKRNTAFLQCVSGNNDIIFTTTSTQFGFKKYKRYARFIVEFFLLLSFSYVLDFGLHNVAFKIKLLNYFKYNHIIRKFIYGVKSFRFRFYCRDTSEEFKRYFRFLKLQEYSEYKYKQRYLFFFVHNHNKRFNLNLNLNLSSIKYNVFSENCSLILFIMLYFQYALDAQVSVSIPSIKYFFKPFYIMFNIRGFGAFYYNLEEYVIKLFYIIKLIFCNFFFFKNLICILLLFYNRLLSFHGLSRLQKRFLSQVSFSILEYSYNFSNFNILKYLTLLFFLFLIKLKIKKIGINLLNKMLLFIFNFLYLMFKSLYSGYYAFININMKPRVLNYIFLKNKLNFISVRRSYFLKKLCERFKNKDSKNSIRIRNLRIYYFMQPNFSIIHVFKSLRYSQHSLKTFWRSFYQSYFKHSNYAKSSYTKFLNSGDGLDIPYVVIKQVLPFGGGCKLAKMRRKKFRLYQNKHRFIGNFL